jgi:GNAT superfamily N-acetyltransferase
MNVRHATSDDADALIALNATVQKLHADAESSIFRQPHSGVFHPKPVSEILAESSNTILIACDGDEVIGYAWIKLQDRPETITTHANHWLNIEHIAVRPDAQGKGVGAALMRRAKEVAREQGIHQLTLTSWSFNTKAHRFFASHGFEPYHIAFRTTID